MGEYVFGSASDRERRRLDAVESVHDPATIRHMETLGIAEGWRCLEVGGGGGSIARWLCGRVGPTGSVVATDLDTRFLDAIEASNIEVRQHDIGSDELEEDAFDLVHARLVLEHLPARDEVLKRLLFSLKPGGRLLVEDYDWGPLLSSPPAVFVHPPTAARASIRVWRSAIRLMESVGYDAGFGRRLPGELVSHGLDDVGAEGRMIFIRGGTPAALMPQGTLERFRDVLVSAGALTQKQIDAEIERFDDPGRAGMVYLMVSAWGSRPKA